MFNDINYILYLQDESDMKHNQLTQWKSPVAKRIRNISTATVAAGISNLKVRGKSKHMDVVGRKTLK
jgi:uncharacterized protein YhbP (UPF0306 family)